VPVLTDRDLTVYSPDDLIEQALGAAVHEVEPECRRIKVEVVPIRLRLSPGPNHAGGLAGDER
jgi:hypothetical protein